MNRFVKENTPFQPEAMSHVEAEELLINELDASLFVGLGRELNGAPMIEVDTIGLVEQVLTTLGYPHD